MNIRLLSELKPKALTRSVALGAGLVLLGACSGFGLNNARDVAPSGTPFEVALHGEYMHQAEAEYAEYDYNSSDTFAKRAVQSASGSTPEPVILEIWISPKPMCKSSPARETA